MKRFASFSRFRSSRSKLARKFSSVERIPPVATNEALGQTFWKRVWSEEFQFVYGGGTPFVFSKGTIGVEPLKV